MLNIKMVPCANVTDAKLLYTLQPWKDERGVFFEGYREKDMDDEFGIPPFVQGNISYSKPRVLRGLHYQTVAPQGKLMRTLSGVTFNAIVDMRAESPTFGNSFTCVMDNGGVALWVPPGFANGFLSLSDSIVMYECSSYHRAGSDTGIYFADPDLGIGWPTTSTDALIVSEKDQKLAMAADAQPVPASEWKPAT